MTVSTTQKSANGVAWLYIAGTAAEVLQELADQKLSARHVVHASDDCTSAIACRR